MLDVMRRHAQSWLIKGIFAILIVVFILFWTEPGQKGTGLQVVANVDGSKITLSEYRRSYENLMNVYRNFYREGLSEEIIKMLKLKEKALDSLIDSRLLLKEADNLGLSVSNSELAESISKYPAFQKDNAFDKAQYMAVLKANRLTPEEFEEGQRRNILVSRVEGIIKEGAKVSDDEIWDAYVRQKEKVNVELIRIEPKDFVKDIKVSEDEAKEYFSKNKETLKVSKYEDAKEKVNAALTMKKAGEMALKKGEELLKGLKEGKLNIPRLPHKPVETGLFGRGGGIPKAGPSEEANKAAFSLTKEAPYPAKPFSINGAACILRFKERVEADREGLKTEEDMLRMRLTQQKGEEALKSWLKTARATTKIKIYDEFLQ